MAHGLIIGGFTFTKFVKELGCPQRGVAPNLCGKQFWKELVTPAARATTSSLTLSDIRLIVTRTCDIIIYLLVVENAP